MIRHRAGAVALGLVLLAGCSGAAPEQAAPREQGAPITVHGAPPAEPVPAPASVTIPAIGASSTLVGTGVNPDGTAEVPPVEQPEQASYYRPGVNPGAVGRAVVMAHVNGAGRPGLFVDLHELEQGDAVEITRVDGEVERFQITRVESFPKDEFPTGQVWGPTHARELALVTCGGEFIGGDVGYAENVIAFATLV